jgi:fumarate reductase subunit D
MKWKHSEPFFWGMFGAGGMSGALVVPPLVLVVAILMPLGIGDGLFHLLQASLLARLVLWAVIMTACWSGCHRIVHGLHDLGFHPGPVARITGYGFATFISVLALILAFAAG